MRHIPSGTSELEILSFREAFEMYRSEHTRDYDPQKWMYIPDFYTEYRYILGTYGRRPLITIGINPSTAVPDALDNTLKSVERIARGNGRDSFIMFNVYAERATDPKNMEHSFNERLHRENMEAFRYALGLSDEPAVWAAWGTLIKTRPYLRRCVEDMIHIGAEYNAVWYTCGARSKNGGHPHHPLYLKKDALLEEFDPAEYLAGKW